MHHHASRRKPRRLGHEPLQFREEWAVWVSLVVNVLPLNPTPDNPGGMQVRELSLEACLGGAEMTREVACVPGTRRLHEESSQHPLSDFRKEGVSPSVCTHHAYLCTQLAYLSSPEIAELRPRGAYTPSRILRGTSSMNAAS